MAGRPRRTSTLVDRLGEPFVGLVSEAEMARAAGLVLTVLRLFLIA